LLACQLSLTACQSRLELLHLGLVGGNGLLLFPLQLLARDHNVLLGRAGLRPALIQLALGAFELAPRLFELPAQRGALAFLPGDLLLQGLHLPFLLVEFRKLLPVLRRLLLETCDLLPLLIELRASLTNAFLQALDRLAVTLRNRLRLLLL